MTARYLVRTASATIGAAGTATVTLSPSSSEVWAVVSARVSTAQMPQDSTPFVINPSPYCAVYQGATGQFDLTTFQDDTTLGSGDTTSIMSGTITNRGESLSAQWASATPGDTATLTIYGRSYENLEELQELMAPVPGIRFAGTTGNAQVWLYNANQQAGPGNLLAAPASFITPSNCAVEIVSAKVTINTSAAGGTRVIGIQASGNVAFNTIDFFRSFNGMTQGNSLSWAYVWGQGMEIAGNNITTNIIAPLPQRMILPPTSTVRLLAGNADAADTWTAWNVSYRQYTSLTKVTFP